MSIKFFEQIQPEDIAGGKGLSLAKMYQKGINVPNGYVILADTFDEFLEENKIAEEIKNILINCNIEIEEDINKASEEITKTISKANISEKLKEEIIKYYEELDSEYVAVRSSAISEDGKEYAWAGQLETFLNVDKDNIIESVKKCWISGFSSRAIFYRIKNTDIENISVAVVVQKMVQSEISGVAFSVNPITNNSNELVIEAVIGLGEAIVSGKVTPDTYIVNKKDKIIKNKEIKLQKEKIIKFDKETKWINIDNENTQKLSDKMVIKLMEMIQKLEQFYGFPVDVEWGIEKEKIYILQCRPITTISKNELVDKIKNAGDWKFYVSRRFNWFVENTEIYSTMEKFQKKILGFFIPIGNYLCLNGDEYALESGFDAFEAYAKEDNFFEKFAQIEFDLIKEVKEYLEYLKNKNFKECSFEELSEEFEKFNDMYIKSFIPGMTRPDDFLVTKLEKELNNDSFSKEEVELIFSKISTCPNYDVLSYSEEPLDLLKIALKKNNGENIESLLEEHIEKYAWIKGPVELEDTCFKKEEYLLRLENLLESNIEEKIKNIENVRKNNDIEYENILKEYDFSLEIQRTIKAIRDFIFLRTYTTEYSDHLFYVARHTIFEEISKRINIETTDLIMLDDLEILQILKQKGNIDLKVKDILEKRKTGFAMIWLDNKVETVFGAESLKLQNEIAKMYKVSSENNEEYSNIICGSVANKGKVRGRARVLNKYEDIYNVEKGDIIVATMTTPDYVSAMEKAAGFVTDEGGITCHAAILSREFNVPCIVGTINGTKLIEDGKLIELDAYSGKVYILDN